MDCKNFSTKNNYSKLKYISSLLVLDKTKTTLLHGYNFINKRNKPKNIFYRNEVQYRGDVPTKRKVGL